MKKILTILVVGLWISFSYGQIISKSNGNVPTQSTDNLRPQQLLDMNNTIKNENLGSQYPVESIPVKEKSFFDHIYPLLKTIKIWIKENIFIQLLIVFAVIYSGYLKFKKKKEGSSK